MEMPIGKEQWFEGVRRFSEGTAITPLSVEFVDVDDEKCILTMPITDAARQSMGLLHGGISMLLAETAASVHASWGIDLTEGIPVGMEINGSHLRSAAEGHVRAVATLLRRSQSHAVHRVDIYHVETGNLLSTARVTNRYKKPDPAWLTRLGL
jgi:uncharacterized protein (TIGR00369 family)